MERGQTTIEYAGAVTLVAVVLSVAAAVAAPDLPKTIVDHLRVALCIAGGDVCRGSDAERAGLEPCVLTARSADQRFRITVAAVSYGADDDMVVERRSDGSARVSFARRDEGGVSVSAGMRLGPRSDVSVEGGGALGWTSGYAWELPDEASLQRFLKETRLKPGNFVRTGSVRPSERFRAVSASAGAEAGARIVGLDQALVSGSGRAAIGRRSRGGRDWWYFDARREGLHLFGGLIPEVELAQARGWVIELSDAPRVLRLTASLPGDTEIEARLDLTEPANAAVARALLQRPSPARARALGRHMAEHGTVERRTYRVRPLRSRRDVGVDLGFAGVDFGGDASERTLVSAEVLRPGRAARRADCLGV